MSEQIKKKISSEAYPDGILKRGNVVTPLCAVVWVRVKFRKRVPERQIAHCGSWKERNEKFGSLPFESLPGVFVRTTSKFCYLVG